LGEEVLDRARRLVQEADHLKEDARRIQEGLTGTIRVGLGSGPGAILTLPLLRHMATHHPRAHLELARANTALLTLALRERRLDALVVDARSLPPAEDIEVQSVAELRGAFLCRPEHPLTQRPGPLRFADKHQCMVRSIHDADRRDARSTALMSIRSWLMPAISQRLLSQERLLRLRARAERSRQTAGRRHEVRYFHQVDDPYSALVAGVLPQLLARFEALRRTSSAWDGWEREARAAFEARVAASVLGEAEDARLEQVMTTDVL
jgi:hypothetical protein